MQTAAAAELSKGAAWQIWSDASGLIWCKYCTCPVMTMSDVSSVTAFDKELHVRIDLKPLPDVRSLNRWCPGCVINDVLVILHYCLYIFPPTVCNTSILHTWSSSLSLTGGDDQRFSHHACWLRPGEDQRSGYFQQPATQQETQEGCCGGQEWVHGLPKSVMTAGVTASTEKKQLRGGGKSWFVQERIIWRPALDSWETWCWRNDLWNEETTQN